MIRLLPIALLAVACARSGAGARNGNPIDARGQALELVACLSTVGQEHNQTEVTATTLRGLNSRKLASRAGQETGGRGHPTDANVVVLARQLRAGEPESTEIYVSSLTGAFADVRMTRDSHTDLEPCWSADGQRVLFASDRGGTFLIWRIDRNGTNLAAVTQVVTDQADRAPDARGDRIVFSRAAPTLAGRRAAIWMMNADGSGLAQVTDGIVGTGTEQFAPGDHEPALAPDLSSVVFVRRTAVARATLMRIELANQRLSTLAATSDGEDRLPRFFSSGDRVLVARTAPSAGLLGRRLVTMSLTGTDVAQLTLDARLACQGAVVLAGSGAWPAAVAQATPSELETDDARLLLGQRTLGRFDLVRVKDGSGLQLATTAFDGKEAAGVFLPFKLGPLEPTDVALVHGRVTFALTLASPQARVRVSVQDYVRDRFDVAWEGAVTSTAFVDVGFAFTSLAHVDRNGWIRLEVVAELPEGQRAEFALDAVEVDVFGRAP